MTAAEPHSGAGMLDGPVGSVDEARYRRAEPWPHAVVERAFDPQVIAAAESEQDLVAQELEPHVSRRQRKAETAHVRGPASEAIVDYLTGDGWVAYLRSLTGICDLESDPTLFWAGLHVSSEGDFQAVHRDFQKHPATGLYHRVNALLYLSSDWRPEEGGALELWSPDAHRCVKRILPAAGRLVVFESNARTLHAVGLQTSTTAGRHRLSLAAYYYSHEPPACGVKRLGTLFQPRVPGTSPLASLIDAGDAARGAVQRLGALRSRLGRRTPDGE